MGAQVEHPDSKKLYLSLGASFNATRSSEGIDQAHASLDRQHCQSIIVRHIKHKLHY
jgi:hypothetical protein